MEPDDEPGAVSTLESLAEEGDIHVNFPGDILRPCAPFVGLAPIRQDFKRVQQAQTGGS